MRKRRGHHAKQGHRDEFRDLLARHEMDRAERYVWARSEPDELLGERDDGSGMTCV